MAWRAAFPATLLSLLAFVACRGATGDALPVAPSPRPAAPPAASSVALCPTAAPTVDPAPVAAPAPTVDPAPTADPGPWISTLPRDPKPLGSHVLCGTARCEGDAPWCCPERSGPRCVSTHADCAASSMFQCMSASDCGAGRICCMASGGTQCDPACTSGSTPLCTTDADCRGVRMPGPEGTSFAQGRCRPSPDLGLRRCAAAWE